MPITTATPGRTGPASSEHLNLSSSKWSWCLIYHFPLSLHFSLARPACPRKHVQHHSSSRWAGAQTIAAVFSNVSGQTEPIFFSPFAGLVLMVTGPGTLSGSESAGMGLLTWISNVLHSSVSLSVALCVSVWCLLHPHSPDLTLTQHKFLRNLRLQREAERVSFSEETKIISAGSGLLLLSLLLQAGVLLRQRGWGSGALWAVHGVRRWPQPVHTPGLRLLPCQRRPPAGPRSRCWHAALPLLQSHQRQVSVTAVAVCSFVSYLVSAQRIFSIGVIFVLPQKLWTQNSAGGRRPHLWPKTVGLRPHGVQSQNISGATKVNKYLEQSNANKNQNYR